MAYKDILVHVDGSPRSEHRLRLAAQVAERDGGRVIALFVRSRPQLPQYIAAQYGSILDQVQDEFEAQGAKAAQATFERIRSECPALAEWRDVTGPMAATVALHARYADLTVLGQGVEADDDSPLSDCIILEVGRPVLMVPRVGTFPTIGTRVLVAWNGTREATRAVHDALPLLIGAKLVHVIAVNPEGGMAGHGDVPGADICLHLSRHGVNAVCEHIRSEDLNVGEMLLSRAADEDVDLLVMGAYGRSRLRELVLGGATRHLIGHMTVPVLMSH